MTTVLASPHFEIREGRDRLGRRRWRWVLRAANGEVIAVSETYNSREAAIDTIHLIRAVAHDAPIESD